MTINFNSAATMQLTETTSVANLLSMDLDNFKSAIAAIKKEYKDMHNLKPEKEIECKEGQKAFVMVLNKARVMQENASENFGITLAADKAIEKAISNMSGHLVKDYSVQSWMKCFADRIATVLQNARFTKWCNEHDMDTLNVAQNLVWKGCKKGGTWYVDEVLRNGLVGEEWEKLSSNLFNRDVIYDFVRFSERMYGLNIDDFISSESQPSNIAI